MDRRRFLASLGSGAAALAAFGGGLRVFAQDYPKDFPLNCTPPLPGGSPKPVTLIKRSLVPRKSAFDLSPAEVQRLRDAYTALRDLSLKDPLDPRGWRQQAGVHCYYCSGGYDSLGTEIHGGWWFLPWHRCYLYVHERILGSLIGDADFRLPYWDWDTIPDALPNSRRTVPAAYDAPTYEVTRPAKISIANSLYDRTRGGTATYLIPTAYVGKTAIKTAMCQEGANFMGGPSIENSQSGQAGQLEMNPHGPVHLWSGDPRTAPSQPAPFGCYFPLHYPYDPKDPNSFPGDNSQTYGCTDMGVLATAAQDPIFFAHHCNIDRLWGIWLQMSGTGHTNPTDPNWVQNGWSFYDENKNWVTITVQQVLDEEKDLGYSYQPPQVKGYTTTPAVCLLPPPKAKAATPLAAQALQPLSVAEDQQGATVGTKPHTRSVALPPEHQTGLRSLADGGDQRRYELHVDGVTLPPNGGVIVRVFLNLPDANTSTEPDAQHFAGYIAIVPTGPGHQHRVVRNVAFDLTPELAATVAATGQLSVTLVPVTAGGAEPVQSNMSYQRIYLTAK